MKANYPDSNIQLIEGRSGIFDVKCNDKLIFSKNRIAGKRFPNEGEITKLIEKE